MAKGDTRRGEYFDRVRHLFREYSKVFVVNVDNVTSTQMHQIRASLRGQAVILMGKNTMVRKAMREVVAENPKLEVLLSCIRGNVGLVFTNSDLKAIRDIMTTNRVQAGAKIGLIAQKDVFVPAGNTGIDPNKTSFFQALGIPTKVVKGAIEIVNDVLIIKTGQKVGASEASLLNMLNIMPFTFGLTVLDIYDDGSLFSPSVLDITDEILTAHVQAAIKNIASISLATKFPTMAAVPHLLFNAYKNVLGVALATEYSFPAVEEVKEKLKNAAAAPTASASASAAKSSLTAPAAAPAAAAKEESEEEEDLGMGLFD